jgi:hypothetical protein
MTVQDRPGWSIDPAQSAVVDGDGRRYTYMNETRNETNQAPGHRWLDAVHRPDLPLPRRVREPWPVHHRPFYFQLHVSWLFTPVALR